MSASTGKRRKAREWDVVVGKAYGSMLLPHDMNEPCGDENCCEWIIVREVLPPRKKRNGKKKEEK